MGKVAEFMENAILIGYCVYCILTGLHHIAQNAKFTVDHNAHGWIDNHHWPEFEVALAIMAIAGLLLCRRFVFCFTALFFVFRTAVGVFGLSVDLLTLSSGRSLTCINAESIMAGLRNSCKWGDIFAFIYDTMTFVSLALMSAVVFIRLFYFAPSGRNSSAGEHYSVELKCSEKKQQQQYNLPIFAKYHDEQQKKQQQDIGYYDDEPYKPSVI